MYWRVRRVSPQQMVAQYGVHVALIISLLANVLLYFTRPNTKGMSAETKVDFDNFARRVTTHLLDTSYISYAQSTAALITGPELAPNVVQALRQSEMLFKTDEEFQATERMLKQQRQLAAVRIDSVQLGEPTQGGLVPVTVAGVVAIHSAEESGPSGPVPFQFQYLIGQHKETMKPIVAQFADQSRR